MAKNKLPKAMKKIKLTKPIQKNKMHKIMSEFKESELNIGKSPKKVKNKAQAIAIGLHSASKLGKKTISTKKKGK